MLVLRWTSYVRVKSGGPFAWYITRCYLTDPSGWNFARIWSRMSRTWSQEPSIRSQSRKVPPLPPDRQKWCRSFQRRAGYLSCLLPGKHHSDNHRSYILDRNCQSSTHTCCIYMSTFPAGKPQWDFVNILSCSISNPLCQFLTINLLALTTKIWLFIVECVSNPTNQKGRKR